MRLFFSGDVLVSGGDFIVLGLFLVAMLAMGWHFKKQQTSTAEFYLGRRQVPQWAACLSFVATEVSAVTVIAVPATAYMENWEYLQFFIGSAVARLIIAYLFIPAFYKLKCTTIYEYLGSRFGFVTQITATVFFFMTRLLGSGVRLMAACLAMSVLFGVHIEWVILLFVIVGIVYISSGGIKAVIWTNVLQALVFIVGGLATLAFLSSQINGGLSEAFSLAGEAGKLKVMNWGPSMGSGFFKALFEDPNIIWLAVLNGLFISLAAFGTDQDFMQRLLTLETSQESQRTITWTIPLSFSVVLIHLCIGVGLYAFYSQNPELLLPEKMDKIFPHFIGHVMPQVLRGLLLSAIVLASIDSPLASLSTSFVTDIYKPLSQKVKNKPPEQVDLHLLSISRRAILVFGVILAFVAYLTSHMEKILWLAFKIWSITFGSLLGVFLLGLLTKKKSNWGNLVAMVTSAVLMAVLLLLSEKKILPIGWSWLVVIGTALTYFGGMFLGPLMDKETNGRTGV